MADTAYGVSISFATGFLAEITGFSVSGIERPAIDVSHTQSPDNNKQYVPGDLVDNGEISVSLNFDETEDPPIKAAPEVIVITWGSGATWTFTGFMTGYEVTAELEDRNTADVTIKITGSIVIG